MIAISTILVWLIFAVGNIFLARWHASIIEKAIAAKKKTVILHGLWALAYAGVSFIPMIPHWLTAQWMCALLGISFAMLHASVFSVYLNRYRGLSDFSLSHTSKSWFDQLQCQMGFKTSKPVNITAFFLSIATLTFFIFKYPVK